ncbi:MAG: hypothetical protein C5B49_02985 [Bdellovibrio sp.]|nr:MAG: hypothetical protein C5B49_02985 [Bdellovibrio sp.]
MSPKIVILTGKPNSMRAAESFLRNRKWDVYSTNNIRDAVAAVIKRRPDFVFLAADHPNRKIKSIPKLLAQAVQVQIIGFVESSATASVAALGEMNFHYSLFPPVSGPSIERIISKIKKDEEQAAQESAKASRTDSRLEKSEKETGISRRIKAGGTASDNTAIVQNSRMDANVALRQLDQLLDDGTETAKTDSSSPAGAGNIAYMPTSQTPAEKDPNYGYIPQSTNESPTGPLVPTSGRKPHYSELQSPDGDGKAKKQKPRFEVGEEPPEREKPVYDPYAADWESKTNEQFRQPPSGEQPANFDLTKPDAVKARSTGEVGGVPQPPSTAILTQDSPPTAEKNVKTGTQQDANRPFSQDSIFLRGTQQALDEASQKISGLDHYEELEKSTHAACIIINSPRFSGYLVAAMGKDRRVDAAFMNTVRERLFEFLKSHGELVDDQEQAMELKLEEVEFEDWALHKAEFLRKSIHGSSEVAMAFFPSQETQVQLESSVTDSMLMMNIDDLKDDVPVEFDLYIYMPNNNRFLLYTPQGRPIFGEQRKRLRTRGVNHIHLRKESGKQVKKYRAQVFLNERIAEMKTRIARAG